MRPKLQRSKEFGESLTALLGSIGHSQASASRLAASRDGHLQRSVEAWRGTFARWMGGLVPRQAQLREALTLLDAPEPDAAATRLLGLITGPDARDPKRMPELGEQSGERPPRPGARSSTTEAAILKGVHDRVLEPAEAQVMLRGLRKIGLAGIVIAAIIGSVNIDTAEGAGFQNQRNRPLCQPSEEDDTEDSDAVELDDRGARDRRRKPRVVAPADDQAHSAASMNMDDDAPGALALPTPKRALAVLRETAGAA